MGQHPCLTAPCGTWGCRVPATAPGGPSPGQFCSSAHQTPRKHRGGENWGGERDGWSVLGTARQESRAASTPWSMPPKGKGLANRLLHHSVPQFPHHHHSSTAKRLHELAACLQFQHQSPHGLRHLTGPAGRVALSPSAGSDQELLQPGSPKQPQPQSIPHTPERCSPIPRGERGP